MSVGATLPKKPHVPDFTIDSYGSSAQGIEIPLEALIPGATGSLLSGVQEDQRVFDYDTYAEEVHAPVPLPDVQTSALRKWYPRCLDMPIRLKGDSVYHIPQEWATLASLIRSIASIEHIANPNVLDDYYTYLTIDCSMVEPGQQQRHGGLHVDGFQGKRINPKTKITRNYVVTTNGGTSFYPQKFCVPDPEVFNVFQGFDLQAGTAHVAEEGVVHFMDAYTVHESGFASKSGLRVFMRLTYDTKAFDRAGNTHNAMLGYDWDMVTRDVHRQVITPDWSDLMPVKVPTANDYLT